MLHFSLLIYESWRPKVLHIPTKQLPSVHVVKTKANKQTKNIKKQKKDASSLY